MVVVVVGGCCGAEKAKIEYLGAVDLGDGLGPTKTKGEQHASHMSMAGAQPEEFEVDGDDEEDGGGVEEH